MLRPNKNSHLITLITMITFSISGPLRKLKISPHGESELSKVRREGKRERERGRGREREGEGKRI